MIRRPPRSTPKPSSAASDVYKRQDSSVLQEMRERVLEKLPERQWICGDCGYTCERKRVSMPARCPKCAKPFKS